MKSFLCIVLSCIFFSNYTIANQEVIDSLKHQLEFANEDSIKVDLLYSLAMKFYRFEPEETKKYASEGLELAYKLNYDKGIADCLKALGIYHFVISEHNRAVENYIKALRIYEQLNDIKNQGSINNNVGLILMRQNEPKRALQHFEKAALIFKQIDSKDKLATLYLNIGASYDLLNNFDTALIYFDSCTNLNLSIGDTCGIAHPTNNIGLIYRRLVMHKEAIPYFEKAIQLFAKCNEIMYLPIGYVNLGKSNQALKRYIKAKEAFDSTYSLAKKINSDDRIMDAYEAYYEYYLELKDYKNAHDYLAKYFNIRDSIYSLEKSQQMDELQVQYESEKKEQENIILRKENQLKEATIQKQLYLTILTVILLISAAFIALILYRFGRKQKKTNEILIAQNAEINQQKEEIQTMAEHLQDSNEKIKKQNDEIKYINNQLTASITYAGKIQTALFPEEILFNNYFTEHFIFYKPKSIVSGDFYWMRQIGNYLLLVVADCTGHGVPGALVSMLGISYLNDIVQRKEITATNQVLEELRTRFKNAFKQTGSTKEQRDGMDLALCAVNLKTLEMQYSGAYNSLYLIRNGELIEYKASKNPIGFYFNEKPFEITTIQLQKNDQIYLFSDGYIDQFGAETNQKFKSSQFKYLLLSNCNLGMIEQKQMLEETYKNWKGPTEQVDDVLVVGVKI